MGAAALALEPLRRLGDTSLDGVFAGAEIGACWAGSEPGLAAFGIPDGTGGVNPGDRRAIYHLVRAFGPRSVLEIGTHIGASTLHIAAALHGNHAQDGLPVRLTTVDVRDVNSRQDMPWKRHGASLSPQEMVERLGLAAIVEFVAGQSLDVMSSCETRFDLVFLDGDHSAEAVYREIPAALRVLAPNGIILLHDYFPGLRSLWSNGTVIRGPFEAVERLRGEGAGLAVLPLGALPWPTKLGSNVTSLALLLRA